MKLVLQGIFFGAAVPLVSIFVCCTLLIICNPGNLLTSCISMTCSVSASHMLLHKWQESQRQYQVLVILSLPAVYAVFVGLQQVLPPQALYFGICAEIYEGLGLVNFLLLLRSLAGGSQNAKTPERTISCCGWLAVVPYECMATTLPMYKTAFLLLTTLDSTQHLGLGWLLSRCDLFCSFSLGSLALLAIGRVLGDLLEQRPGREKLALKHKFWAVKGMVTVMFNQSLLLWALDRPLEELFSMFEMEAREDFEATLVAFEMLMLCLWHTVAFPVDDPNLTESSLKGTRDDGAWLWLWTVAQMTILAACLFADGVELMYHVMFVLACAFLTLLAFSCHCARPLRRLVIVGAVSYLLMVYFLCLLAHEGGHQCDMDTRPLSADGLAFSSANCSEHREQESCGELWLQGFCCASCGDLSCPHCSNAAETLHKARHREVLVGSATALAASALIFLARAGYSVLECSEPDAPLLECAEPDAPRAYLEYDSDVELVDRVVR